MAGCNPRPGWSRPAALLGAAERENPENLPIDPQDLQNRIPLLMKITQGPLLWRPAQQHPRRSGLAHATWFWIRRPWSRKPDSGSAGISPTQEPLLLQLEQDSAIPWTLT
ncbi:MAG: hypothetical protein R3E95_11820 [Thiolinea sp.]